MDYKEKYLVLTEQYSRDIDKFHKLISNIIGDLEERALMAGSVEPDDGSPVVDLSHSLYVEAKEMIELLAE